MYLKENLNYYSRILMRYIGILLRKNIPVLQSVAGIPMCIGFFLTQHTTRNKTLKTIRKNDK